MKTAIVTDSNSGIHQKEAEELGIFVLPMPFYINNTLYLEDITLSQDKFYELLASKADIHTSQPSPGDVTDLWDRVLSQYDELVYLPMSSGLSGSCQTAIMLAEDYNGKVEVINNQRISVTLRAHIMEALQMAKTGVPAAKIREILEAERFRSSIYITLETLEYLKRGGRITPLAAAMGTVLNLKPVLQIQGEKLDAYSSHCRGKKAARKTMIEAMKKDFSTRFAGDSYHDFQMAIAYTHNYEEALDWKNECMNAFPGADFIMDPLSLSVSCHIGPGALAIACSHKITL